MFEAGVQTGFDVAQTLAPSQLREHQTDGLLPGGEVLDFVITAVAFDVAVKLLGMDQIEELGKDVLTGVHGNRIAVNWLGADEPAPNRSHPAR
jgi:hypothetical protein